ncbi:serine hydrolase [Streptomyces sp. NRRL S-87]|uniref:serine hydrolase n=1 Tax=Streptomyces sp. NRRL S-87 TaxID=1463920 RepID=UPI0004BE9556|nr:serine hydrolase [Streptomyces sp. NRRL S-87]
MRHRRRGLALATGLTLAAGAVAAATAAPSPTPSPDPVRSALGRLDSQVEEVMRRTGVPGVAVGVVQNDKLVYLKGYGVRSTEDPSRKIDPDTVFQLASVSKPLASTVVAGAIGADGWAKPLTGVTLKDPWVSEHVTAADLFSHRSGLPDHAGDLLEDLGYDRSYILSHLRYEPLTPFRASYAYTNFGLTAAAEAVAQAKGVPWDKLSADVLYKPAGMNHTSSRYEDYLNAPDRALTHVKEPDGTWKPRYQRDADAQSPAGGVSSNARDMTRWLRLQLADGKLDGQQIIDADGLAATHVPEIVTHPPAANTMPGFYGLGWNVRNDDKGRLHLSHSGGFALGANTNVTMVPAEHLGIVVLTNGAPLGQADVIALNFFDTVEHGKPTRDWLPVVSKAYEEQLGQGKSETDYAHPPADARPARADSAYTGTYDNPYYGKLTVTAEPGGGGLVLHLGPKPMDFPLTHYDGDTFSFETVGENAVGRTGVTFKDGTVRIEYLDENGLGTFQRAH